MMFMHVFHVRERPSDSTIPISSSDPSLSCRVLLLWGVIKRDLVINSLLVTWLARFLIRLKRGSGSISVLISNCSNLLFDIITEHWLGIRNRRYLIFWKFGFTFVFNDGCFTPVDQMRLIWSLIIWDWELLLCSYLSIGRLLRLIAEVVV
jgi:hypothetical protein